MDLVYAHGQVEGTLSDGAQGVGATPAWGVAPGSTARTDFYKSDLLKCRGQCNMFARTACQPTARPTAHHPTEGCSLG